MNIDATTMVAIFILTPQLASEVSISVICYNNIVGVIITSINMIMELTELHLAKTNGWMGG